MRHQADKVELIENWNNRFKVSTTVLQYKIKRNSTSLINVSRRLDLIPKYKKQFVSFSELSQDLKVIKKNQLAIFLCNNRIVGGVVRDVALKKVSNFLGNKIKSTVDKHYDIIRGKEHGSSGKLVGHGLRKDPLGSFSGSYAYKKVAGKKPSPEEQRIFDRDGDMVAKWLYNNAKTDMPWITNSYEEFKNEVNLDEKQIIGALFCAENYEAVGHSDNDRTDWALGYVYEIGEVKEGHFFYPEFGVAIEMSSNSIWYWLTQAIHGTAKLDLSGGGVRYTAAISLTEKTARAIEREKREKKE